MVAKGLNFPGVALVGVIAADTGLHIPDFRASERTFQLLTQVAGRAGRSDSSGEVIIQTYCPKENAICCAAEHDYNTFFDGENEGRKALGYPPWGRIARIVVTGKDETEVQHCIQRIAQRIHVVSVPSISILGPSPAVLERVANESRYTILLKSSNAGYLRRVLMDIRKQNFKFPTSITVVIDVDPVNML
jgi:primosomal protein N' (replication factor Y)